VDDKEFREHKGKAMMSLVQARAEGKVDEDIIVTLDIINALPDFFTTSSCSGRIKIFEVPCFGDKTRVTTLGTWHRPAQLEEVTAAIGTAKKGELWLLAQSPILHVGVKGMLNTKQLLHIAISSGFKNSSIKSLGTINFVEICGTERLDCPLGKNGTLVCSQNHLVFLIEIANQIMEKSQAKLDRLNNNLSASHLLDAHDK